MDKLKFHKGYFIAFLSFTILEVLIARYIQDSFIRPIGGDILVIFVLYFFVRAFSPSACLRLPLYVFLFASLIEVSQYFHLVEILGLQDSRIMSVLLGTTFDVLDIVAYGIGAILLLVWQRGARIR